MSNAIMLGLLMSELLILCLCSIYELKTTGWRLLLNDFEKTKKVFLFWWYCLTYCLAIAIASLILLQWAMFVTSIGFSVMCYLTCTQLIKRMLKELKM
ncbi:MAG: hypothetical protein IKF83_00055 [Clostridia bacterium]|nr:hypothetical protein [Clostridia bacterium]